MILRRAHHASLPLVVTAAFLWTVTSLGCADRATPPQASAPSATIVSVAGASTTYHTRDWNGQTVTVRVPSQSAADIRARTLKALCGGPLPQSIRHRIA